MKIVLVNKYWYLKGGSERVVFVTKKLLEEAGHQVEIFGMKHEKNIFENEKSMVCDLTMIRNDHTQFHARINCSFRHDTVSSFGQCMIIITDITKLTRAENMTKKALTASLVAKKTLKQSLRVFRMALFF